VNHAFAVGYESGVNVRANPNKATVTLVKPVGNADFLLVSADSKQFAVHKHVLEAKSGYFKKMLSENNQSFRENIDQQVYFECPHTQLKQLVDFIYNEHVSDYDWIISCIDRFDLDCVSLTKSKNIGCSDHLLAALSLEHDDMATKFANIIAEDPIIVRCVNACYESPHWKKAITMIFQSNRLQIKNERDLPTLLNKCTIPESIRNYIIENCNRSDKPPFSIKTTKVQERNYYSLINIAVTMKLIFICCVDRFQ